MADYDLKSAILRIKSQPLNFGLYRGDDADQVLITPKAPGTKDIAQLEARCGKVKRILRGICFREEQTLVFASKTAPAPAWEMMISKIFKDNKCGGYLPIQLRQLGPNESDEVSVDESAASPAAAAGKTPPEASPPPVAGAQKPPAAASAAPKPSPPAAAPDARAQWDKLKAELIPIVKAAMTDPTKKDAISKIVAGALAKEKAGAFAEAITIFEKLRPIVTPGGGQTQPVIPPSAPPPPKPGVRPPKPGKLQAALNKLTPAIKRALLAHPERKEEILRPVVVFQDLLKKNDLETARKTLAALGGNLKSLLGAPGTGGASAEKAG